MRTTLVLLFGVAGVLGFSSACSGPSDTGGPGTTGPDLDSGADRGAGPSGPAADAGTRDAGGPGLGADSGKTGDSGTGGSMTGDGGTDGGGASDGGCSGVFCDDFEARTPGQAPEAPWTVDVSSAADGKVVVDSTMNHTPSGAKALKLSVAANPSPANAVWAFAELSGATGASPDHAVRPNVGQVRPARQ